ncbi:hypothetical protein BD626DRAFT_565948 [Schizophyllum amplum]|uniref:DHHA2 domain-containing protein n=1 Tax=Schizophyllum amplum TaxID=97359 RepID=A0A550CQ04_9AGAR|nr:hypothetical protein BD626DRAFT_565948 [Auriculariopsis ampla]
MASTVRRLSRITSHLNGSKALKEDQHLAKLIASHKAQYLNDVKSSKGKDWTVVMGNEAADLDSIASSIAYAWVQTVVHHQPTIAYIQCERDDYSLRPENLHALHLAGFNDPATQLLCASDLATYRPFPSTRFALVDHNRLGTQFSDGNPDAHVAAIVDHHEDEGLHKDADPRVVAPSGSCAAHVAGLLPDNLPAELATLVIAAILIDTSGLRPGGKATDVDRAAVARLLPHSTLSSEQSLTGPELHDVPSVSELAQALQTKKADVAALSAWDLLRRDYKEYTYRPSWLSSAPEIRAGLATVPLSLKAWAKGGVLESEGVRYMDARGLSVLGVLTTFQSKKGKHKRQMAWVVRASPHGSSSIDVDAIATHLWTGLEGSSDMCVTPLKSFEPHRWEETGSIHIRVYKQGNAKATRKAVAPLLKKIMDTE